MVRVTTNRGTSTSNVKSGRSKSRRAKPSMRSGRGTVSRSSSGSYGKKRSVSARPRTARRTVNRTGPKRSKTRAIGMRAARASGKVKRSGRGYVTVNGRLAPKRAAPRPSMRSGRGTVRRSSSGSYAKSSKAKPSMRSGRGTVSRVAKRKSRATGMRAGRASGKVRRSGRGYVTVSGGSATKRAAPKPSMRSGRGTIKRSSAGSYKKAARRRPSTRSGRGNVRR